MPVIQSRPLIGQGRSQQGFDLDNTGTLYDTSPIVSFVDPPEVQSPEWKYHFWWAEDLSLIGLRADGKAVTWNPKEAHSYLFDICYPARSSGYCAFSVLTRPLKKFEYPTAFHCIRFPYSAPNLSLFLVLASAMSSLQIGPVDCVQWCDY